MTYSTKILSLKDFVRLYIFMIFFGKKRVPILPKFIFTRIIKSDSIVLLRFVDMITLTRFLEQHEIEYYIIYGHPHRKSPSAFRTLNSFYLAVDLPGVDVLREWLKVDEGHKSILSKLCPLELRADYYSSYTVKY